MSDVMATARLVRPAYRTPGRDVIRTYTEILEDDLGRALDEVERLKTNLQRSQAALMSATAQVKRQAEIIDSLQATSRKEVARLQQEMERQQKETRRLLTGATSTAEQVMKRQQKEIGLLRDALRTQEAQRQAEIRAWRAPRQARIGRLTIRILRRKVELDGQAVRVTPFELAMLLYLAGQPDQVFDTAVIGAAIGSTGEAARTYMYRLRPKMQAIGAQDYLRSKGRGGAWGGYWMTDPEAAP